MHNNNKCNSTSREDCSYLTFELNSMLRGLRRQQSYVTTWIHTLDGKHQIFASYRHAP